MAQFKKAMLIYNGNAGQKNMEKTLGQTVPLLSLHIDELILKPTKQPNDAYDFCRQIDETVELLIILGGDGTVHECMNGIGGLEKRPAVAILPGGTCNDFSRTLGIPQQMQKAAQMIVDGKEKKVDLIKAEDRYVLNFWGIGLIADTSNNINDKEKAVLGKISYFTSALRTLQQTDPFHVRIETEEESWDEEAVIVLVMNGHFIGTNRIDLPHAAINDGKAEILICRNTSFSALKEIFSMNREELEDFTGDLSLIQASSIHIHTKEEMDADTDGEVYMTAPSSLEVLKQHLTFIVPEE
ncbi:YegS/Rv2252/BmrU family lipid kinase [Bacillus safensis]|uniref:YegS/Rv2252/BmrU family lipid kinase n=1 Tax=Bacillus safensis TaxID=561879 RepID=UPI002E22C0AA|nr:YegS/Rv2252/BmrU family lipid kinase [Bacillus safensis]